MRKAAMYKCTAMFACVLAVQVKFGGGTIRINVFPDQTLSVPKLDIELFFFFGRINMYINFVARTDLVRCLPNWVVETF